MSDLSVVGPINQCIAHRKNGDRCKRYASHGTTVCTSHGARAPQVRRKAQQRILEASDKAAAKLIELMSSPKVADNVKLAAARDLLDRANIVGTQQVAIEVGVKPAWEAALEAEGMIEYITVEDREPADVVDAEVVEDDDSAHDDAVIEQDAARALRRRQGKAPSLPSEGSEAPAWYEPNPSRLKPLRPRKR
jgi:hypothetical protein